MENKLREWEERRVFLLLASLKRGGVDVVPQNFGRIIDAFRFEARRVSHPDECTLYSGQISCHPTVQHLNCFLCSCPSYNSRTSLGGCFNGGNGEVYVSPNDSRLRVWDCSNCTKNHSSAEVRVYLTRHCALLAEMQGVIDLTSGFDAQRERLAGYFERLRAEHRKYARDLKS